MLIGARVWLHLVFIFVLHRAGGQVHAKDSRARLVVRHTGRSDGDRQPLHDVQGAVNTTRICLAQQQQREPRRFPLTIVFV